MGLRGEESISALCRREGISEGLKYSLLRELLEAGKARLAGDTVRQATASEVKGSRSESATLKEVVAEPTLENRRLKKICDRVWGVRRMRYRANKKLEIIRTVEASHRLDRQTLKMLSLPSSTYYDWYARLSAGGLDALADCSPRPELVWNCIPDGSRARRPSHEAYKKFGSILGEI